MKKILYILQSYPSIRSANALCDEKVLSALKVTGTYQIDCLAYENYKLPSKESVNGIIVYRFKRSAFWRLCSKARSKDGLISSWILRLNRVVLRLKQLLTILIYPYSEPIMAFKCAKSAKELHRHNNYDIVIAEYHGLDTLHAGSELKKAFPDVVFVAILWDSFTGKESAKYLPARYADWKMCKAEAKELSCADKIVVMESSRKYHEQHSRQKSYYDRFVYLDIPGIVRPPEVTRSSILIHRGKINIVYAGILSLPDRDPEYIINALAHTVFAKDIHLIFICIGEGKQKLEMLEKTFPGEISTSGYIEREELTAVYHGTDVLLNLGGPNPNMVPSKVFEYISYGKPIISTYYVDEEASLKYMKRYPLAVCVDQRMAVKESTELLDTFFEQYKGNKLTFDEIKRMYEQNTPQKYKELIDKIPFKE